MKYPDDSIESVGHLVDQLKSHISGYEGPVWYRGQSNSKWVLEPRLMRTSAQTSESYFLNRFKQDASIILSRRPNDEFEWMFLMQHYGMPTRLLDWSESPLTALYFCVNENEDLEGALWILLPSELNRKSNYRPDYIFEVPSFEDIHLKGYLPSTIAGEQKSKLFPMAAIAPRNSPRMQAQQGVFTISHRENTPIENVGADGNPRDHIWRYLVSAEAKKKIKNELKVLGINRFQLFPELESLSENIS